MQKQQLLMAKMPPVKGVKLTIPNFHANKVAVSPPIKPGLTPVHISIHKTTSHSMPVVRLKL